MTPERRQEIVASLIRISDQLEDPVPKDWEEAAQEREDDEVLEALGQQEQAELRRIEAALDRIEQGEYGACAQCGADIAPARLELLPDTPFCAACAP